MTALLLALAVGPPTAVDWGGFYPFVGRVPGQRWAGFLDRLHAHFDRDGDGRLSATEAARVIRLPLPDGTTIPPSGPCDRAGFREYYWQAGFTPLVARSEPPTLLQRRLAAAVLCHLDRDGDGKLSDAEKRAAPDLLWRLDADDDEVLTAAELLPPGFDTGPLPPAHMPPVRVVFGLTEPPFGACWGGRLRNALRPADPAAGPREAGRFLLAQLHAAGGTLTRRQLDADPALAALAEFLDPADRDGDGTLTAAELGAFLALLAEGVACQWVLTLTADADSWFETCDADDDGRLDRHELATLADRSSGSPTCVLTFGGGPVASQFGPLRLPAAPPAKRPPVAAGGPAWFRALDRNGDGYLSPAEWVGPPAAFRKLDADGDGRVSVAEASR